MSVLRFGWKWLLFSSALWASCVGNGGCPLWLHGHSLVLATPIATNGSRYRYRVEKTLAGTPPKSAEIEHTPWRYYDYGLQRTPDMRPLVGQEPVVIAIREEGITGYVMRDREACHYDVFSLSNPAVKQFVEDRSREWQATLRIRTAIYGSSRNLALSEVMLEGEGIKRMVESDEKGIAVARHLPPGRYKVSAVRGGYRSKPVEVLLTPLGCGTLRLNLVAPTTVSGRVVDAAGKPVLGRRFWFQAILSSHPYARMEERNWFIDTGADGLFELQGLPPEDYFFGANMPLGEHIYDTSYPTVFYPGVRERDEARMIRVLEGEAVEGLELRLPSFGGRRKLVVEVLREDGKPLMGATVGSSHSAQRRTLSLVEGQLKTDARGQVVTEIWGEGRYSIYAYSGDGVWKTDLTPESERSIEPGEGPVKIRIVKGR